MYTLYYTRRKILWLPSLLPFSFLRYMRLVLIESFLHHFSLCLFLLLIFKCFPWFRCAFAQFFNGLVKLSAELFGSLIFQNANFVHPLEIIDISPIRAHCVLTLFVWIDLVWEKRWKIFLQKLTLLLFSRYIQPSSYIFSAVEFLNNFLQSFSNRSDVYTIRQPMKNYVLFSVWIENNLICVCQLTQQRNRYRRETWSGPFHFAVLYFHSILRFSFCG